MENGNLVAKKEKKEPMSWEIIIYVLANICL